MFSLGERRAQTLPGSLFLKDPWKSKTIVEEEPLGIVDEITLDIQYHPVIPNVRIFVWNPQKPNREKCLGVQIPRQ